MFVCGVYIKIFHHIRRTGIHTKYEVIATSATVNGVVSSATDNGVITRKCIDAVIACSDFIAININIVAIDYIVTVCTGYDAIMARDPNEIVIGERVQLNILKNDYLAVWQVDVYVVTHLAEQRQNLGLELGITKCRQVNLFVHCVYIKIFHHIRRTSIHTEYETIATSTTVDRVVSSATVNGVVARKCVDGVVASSHFIAIDIRIGAIDYIVTGRASYNAIMVLHIHEIITGQIAQVNAFQDQEFVVWQGDMDIVTYLCHEGFDLRELGKSKCCQINFLIRRINAEIENRIGCTWLNAYDEQI